MLECDKLQHPFQNDPGVSQRQRVMDNLLAGPAKIDARSLADLLQFFTTVAPHINYYDNQLSPGDWTPFFKNSLPFLLANIAHYDVTTVNDKFSFYTGLFKKRPTGSGLQLNIYYIYYNFIRSIDTWYGQLSDSQLPLATLMGKVIQNKLRQPLLQFIGICNAAVKWYGVRRIDFTQLLDNPVWGLELTDLYALDTTFKKAGKSNRKRLLALQKAGGALVPSFSAAFGLLSAEACKDIPQSLQPLAASLQQQHAPHLALIFVFLQLFRQLQSDLNGFRKEHLDFFYKNILQLAPQAAIPDQANIVIALQNQVKQYGLAKGLLVKDGKDRNNTEIQFSLDDAIAVNLTQVTDQRTLFLNNKTAYEKTYIEGLYMAPNATMADGVSIAFTAAPENYPTLGAEDSKYTPPMQTSVQPYPGARIGFILASPVLFLNEGKRHVHITLQCTLVDGCGAVNTSKTPQADPCCPGATVPNRAGVPEDYPAFVTTTLLYPAVHDLLSHAYVQITDGLIQQALQKGITPATGDILRKFLIDDCRSTLCCSAKVFHKENTVIRWDAWETFIAGIPTGEAAILDLLFLKIHPLKLSFSGAKAWIEPSTLHIGTPSALTAGTSFQLDIHAHLHADLPAVTFYNNKALNEDFNTQDPLVKVELDDRIKIALDATLQTALGLTPAAEHCCLDRTPDLCGQQLSLYQFFRNVIVTDAGIRVRVCGLKNVIVQNDESLQDVNSPVYPFGTRPRIESNFFIGSEEIFLKHWENIYINMNWKDFPLDPPAGPFTGPFNQYYNGYQTTTVSGVINEVLDERYRKQIAILQDGKWIPWKYDENCSLAAAPPHTHLFHKLSALGYPCKDDENYLFQYRVFRANDFVSFPDPAETIAYKGIKRMDVSTRQSFIRITMKCQDFRHDQYAFILARQMTALGRLPDIVDGAVYYNDDGGPYQLLDLNSLFSDIIYASRTANDATLNAPTLSGPGGRVDTVDSELTGKTTADAITNALLHAVQDAVFTPDGGGATFASLKLALDDIFARLKTQQTAVQGVVSKGAVIPNAPWTPIISNMSLDYTATADATQLSLIHLYPYTGTYKEEEILLHPPLFPVFCDEGTLFLGLTGLVPGSNVNFLFQLAEATADSESNQARVYWSYLDDNQWLPLRPGFEILADGTDALTRSGIVKLSLPANMTHDNSVMPRGSYWIKAAVAQNSRGISETLAIATQAVSVTFTNTNANDKTRLGTPLAAGSLSKLVKADAKVKAIDQPYPGFGGMLPEEQGQYYVRVSELLHHKGRAIQKFDYERLTLQHFPVIFKAKCINHSFALDGSQYKNDFPMAPGYVLLAVIPDLNQLAAGNSLQPKVPVSILESIEDYIRSLTSPFVRFRAMNPRYERINFCLTVQLTPGMDPNFYKQQLQSDLSQFLAPWAVGEYGKLNFGQPVYRSDIVGFLENRPYVDYIVELEMFSEFETVKPAGDHLVIYPVTPRSILIAGEIDVCIQEPACEEWGRPACTHKPIPL